MADAIELARLRNLARKVGMVHGPSHPAMVELAAVVERVAAAPVPAAEDRAALSRLTDGFTPWPEACGTVRALYAGLQTL